ncbi:helix-turn-helix transcriptional regulator [Planosporangium thailandense]|uniref:Helix-turn-helix transcriptional regulator n=1 Tax=Planosporangium thailandense TaxID=765197 RepID=A0ABX0Y5F7_9ACTN|nr:helix-turn-helix transcriptional regulator [Planosporangium thailandense]NJC72635.1 helix-turn-helix transcriptional regulator [Planosporangium thailandense]
MPHGALSPLRIQYEFWSRDDVVAALRTRDIGALFRLIRRYTGASQTQLGIAVGLEQGYVSRIISGRKVMTIDVLERIADGCGMPDEARITVGLAPCRTAADDTSTISAGQADGSWQCAVGRAVEFWGGDVERRDMLRYGVFSAAGYALPALQWFTSEDDLPHSIAGRRTVGQPDVDMIREMTGTLRQLDNQYGGVRTRATAARYLYSEVAPLLRDGRFDDRTGRLLFSAVAEVSQLAGWMAYDSGEHGVAQRYLTHALDLARSAGDRPLGAEILAAMSHQATYLGDARTAIDLARAARRTAAEAGIQVLVAEAAVMEAHAHARGGDGRACATSLSRAEQALDRADRSLDPQWISYFDTAYMSAKFAHCFRELGQARKAEHFAIQSLRMDGRYVRGRTFNLLLLATTHAQQDDYERACVIGGQALTLMAQIQSVRAVEYLRVLQERLSRYATFPVVRQFNARAAAATGRDAQASSSPR